MARQSERHAENVDGEWFIDRRCIGCGAAWSLAPDLVVPASDGKFVFARQPESPHEVRRAQLAAEVCPTRSVGTRTRQRWETHHPLELRPGVWRLGGNAWSSAGGHSHLARRPDGNVMVDAPRWSARLASSLADLGGVRDILLTHSDDVADAGRYAEHFGARVWIHEADHDAAPFATGVLTGREPVGWASGALVVPTPGHTRGHMMLLLDEQVLFSGDSLAWEPDPGRLGAEEAVCWYSWPEQLDSLERLLGHRFEQLVPSHGAPSPRLPPPVMHRHLRELLGRLRS